jgi:hypothetical protein
VGRILNINEPRSTHEANFQSFTATVQPLIEEEISMYQSPRFRFVSC